MSLPLGPQVKAQQLPRTDVDRELHKHRIATTPYGDLLQPIDMTLKSGNIAQVEVVNLCALLWYLASQPDAGNAFLIEHLGSKDICNIAIYCDGVTPGNALRPDEGRSFEAVYWTISELPAWYRSKETIG